MSFHLLSHHRLPEIAPEWVQLLSQFCRSENDGTLNGVFWWAILNLNVVHDLAIFSLYLVLFMSCIRNICLPQGHQDIFLYCFLEVLFVLPSTYRSVVHVELLCVCVWCEVAIGFHFLLCGIQWTQCHLWKILPLTWALHCHLCLQSGVHFYH